MKTETFPRERNAPTGRRYHVTYDLIYDGGSSRWTGYYHLYAQARLMILWNRLIASWGGTATLVDTWGRTR